METKKQNNNIILMLLLGAGLLWIFLFRDFWLGRIGLFPDGASYFNWTRFYFDSISQGMYPLWLPFDNWGYPVGFKIRFLGEFNPFLLIAYIPYKLGLPYHLAYFLYAITYYFIGVCGFYLISLHLFKDKYMSCLSAVLLMFSNAAIAIFFNFCEVVLLIPAIWFFYFWLKFHKTFSKSSFVGLVFTLMIILTTYMPFYFLTIFFAFVLICLLLYVRDLKGIFQKYYAFIKKNKYLTVICVILLILSSLPGYITYKETGSTEFSYAHRQANSGDTAVTTGLSMVNAGSILGPVTFNGLFSDLSYHTNYLSYFYLSIIVYPILFITLFNRLNKRLIICFFVTVLMLLIAITDATPLLGLLYKHIFYFKVIRNIFYLMYLIIPFIIIYVVEQLGLWLNENTRARYAKAIWVTIVFTVFGIYLFSQGNIIPTSYVCLIGCWVMFILYSLGNFQKRENIFWIALIVMASIQPIEVYVHYVKNVAVPRDSREMDHLENIQFLYQRPKIHENTARSRGILRDNSGFMEKKFAGTKGAALLQKNINPKGLSNYTQNKFIVYDHVTLMEADDISWKAVGDHLMHLENEAFIASKDGLRNMRKLNSPVAKPIVGESPVLKVVDFGLNEITIITEFEEEKFLVYNDSFHSNWQATVNDVPAKIYRANIAFKGLWIKPGENIIKMRFGSRWFERFYFLLSGLFLLLFVYLIYLHLRDRRSFNYA